MAAARPAAAARAVNVTVPAIMIIWCETNMKSLEIARLENSAYHHCCGYDKFEREITGIAATNSSYLPRKPGRLQPAGPGGYGLSSSLSLVTVN